MNKLLYIENAQLESLQNQINDVENQLHNIADNYDDIPGVGYVVRAVEEIGEAALVLTSQLIEQLQNLNSLVSEVLSKISQIQDLIDEWLNKC